EDWSGVYASIAGSYYFLRNGEEIHEFLHEEDAIIRKPRTAIGYNDEHIFFIVADGRDPGISEGMTVAEMAYFARDILNADEGIMQDGGGSSTMVINGEVVNNTFCNNALPHCFHVFLPLSQNSQIPVTSEPTHSRNSISELDSNMETQILQRYVANGMMMVVVEPMEQSTQAYDPFDPVTTNGSITVYLGPGDNYAVLPERINGVGTISDPLNKLGGVYAKGSYWWKVNFGSTEGWVIETDISPILKYQTAKEFKPR
ncbi:MAG: phosphodiester glycosidase family protein, partial [Anaerolineales bacterium]